MRTGDDDIKRTIRAGERNQEVTDLVRNWCRHAKVVKHGGTGLIELQTGLPIGHHGLACDHAPLGGMASWDLTDAAIDFHDRNCVQCTKRVAVGLPNLGKLIAERDAHNLKVAKEREAEEAKRIAELTARDTQRAEIRAHLRPECQSILEFIAELDHGISNDSGEKLLGAAQLAPETFTSPIIEYCFSLFATHQTWFYELGLKLLHLLKADTSRLASCAMQCLASHDALATACEIVHEHAHHVKIDQIEKALPALTWRAHPEHNSFGSHQSKHDPAPLLTIYRAHKDAVNKAIASSLDSRSAYRISVGARAIIVLAEHGGLLASEFCRPLGAKLARAHLLIDSSGSRNNDEEVFSYLKTALSFAFKDDPQMVDDLVWQYLMSTSVEGQERILSTYSSMFRLPGRWDDQDAELHPAAHLALRRLIHIGSNSKEYDLLMIVQDALRAIPENAIPLVRTEIDYLLGGAICLDDRIQSHREAKVPQADYLASLEHSNLLHLLLRVQEELVTWCAAAAANDKKATADYLDVLRKIPDGKDQMRAVLVSRLHALMATPAGLNAGLPDLYSSMMSMSSIVRSAAAETIGKLKNARLDDLPELLFEAFAIHLTDPYVIVHQAAVDALNKFSLPAEFEKRARLALLNLITCYGIDESSDKRFLIKVIEVFMSRLATPEDKKGGVGKVCLALLEKVEPSQLVNELYWLSYHLKEAEGYSHLILRISSDEEATRYDNDKIIRALNALPIATIFSHKDQLVAAATAEYCHDDLKSAIVESLTRSGAWQEAVDIHQIEFDSIPDTTQQLYKKLYAKLHLIAAKYEAAISLGQRQVLTTLSTMWKETESHLKRLDEEYEQRNNPFPSLPRSY